MSIFSGNTMVRVHKSFLVCHIVKGRVVAFYGRRCGSCHSACEKEWVALVTHDGATNYPVGPRRTQNPLHTIYNVDLGFPCEGFPRLIASVRKLVIVTYFYSAFDFAVPSPSYHTSICKKILVVISCEPVKRHNHFHRSVYIYD